MQVKGGEEGMLVKGGEEGMLVKGGEEGGAGERGEEVNRSGLTDLPVDLDANLVQHL